MIHHLMSAYPFTNIGKEQKQFSRFEVAVGFRNREDEWNVEHDFKFAIHSPRPTKSHGML